MMRVGDAVIHAFEDRAGRFIFVGVPDEYGRYVRTRVAVVLAACPGCGSRVGEPCRGDRRYTGSIHADRLVAARRVLLDMLPGSDGGVSRTASQEFEVDDAVGGDRPEVIVKNDEDGTIDLRRFFR